VPPESRKRFKAALALLEAGESEALIFPKVDRASRCTEDFAQLIRLSEEQDWRLIVTEIGIDTRTPMGKAMAHMAVVFAERWPRDGATVSRVTTRTRPEASGRRMRRRSMWAIGLFPCRLTAVSLLLQPGLDAGAAIANVAADAVAPRAFTAMTPARHQRLAAGRRIRRTGELLAVEGVDRYPEHRR
jgi:hypothetical protein